MKFITAFAVAACILCGCVSLNTTPDEDSAAGPNFDARTGLCTDATPAPCTAPRD